MAQRMTTEIRGSDVEIEYVHHRYLGWQVGSWWTDNERVTQADVDLAADDVITENADQWSSDEQHAARYAQWRESVGK